MSFEVRAPRTPEPMGSTAPRPPTPMEAKPGDKIAVFGGDGNVPDDPVEAEKSRHAALMDCMQDEGDRQQEERYHMAIDEDYQDHLHWRPEDAAVLLERGQAPLVFNEGRQTIEWISGMEKRMRKDFKVLPREPDDEAGAELKTKLLKYTDDANMTQWVRSKHFKQTIVGGLSWMEEGINPDPEQEIIYAGGEDWRNVLRDSRSRDIMLRDARVLFRRKKLDLDYAQALVGSVAPEKLRHLKTSAYKNRDDSEDAENGPWYLGQKLTGASEMGARKSSSFEERGAYTQNTGYYDSGRRLTVDLVEAWYRVPQPVKVFVGGTMDGKVVNKADPKHTWEVSKGTMTRDAVKMRMRVMLCTETDVLWDGDSPFRHGQFCLVPMFAYRRARDGQAYGVWRGMRDLSDDTNKRRSKSLWSLSVNRIVAEEGATDDLEALRIEAARPDAIIIVNQGKKLEFVPNTQDMAGNLEMANMNVQIMRNIGGVTNENLGQDTNAQSGKAILAKQDQGGLTTSDLFDNMLISIQQCGKLRLSHMEQFWTERKAVRIVGGRKPIDWVVINDYDAETGEFKNDITQREADFIVDTQDYRSSMAQAALEQMFGLLGQIATFAPQVVLNVLDLVVESADIKDKEEWVNRIRKLNGQRDPSKAPTPEEQAQDMDAAAKEKKAQATLELLGEAELKLKQGLAEKANHDAILSTVTAAMERMKVMQAALEAAGIVMANPHAVDAADEITKAAGLDDPVQDAVTKSMGNAAQQGGAGLEMPVIPGAPALTGAAPGDGQGAPTGDQGTPAADPAAFGAPDDAGSANGAPTPVAPTDPELRIGE